MIWFQLFLNDVTSTYFLVPLFVLFLITKNLLSTNLRIMNLQTKKNTSSLKNLRKNLSFLALRTKLLIELQFLFKITLVALKMCL